MNAPDTICGVPNPVPVTEMISPGATAPGSPLAAFTMPVAATTGPAAANGNGKTADCDPSALNNHELQGLRHGQKRTRYRCLKGSRVDELRGYGRVVDPDGYAVLVTRAR